MHCIPLIVVVLVVTNFHGIRSQNTSPAPSSSSASTSSISSITVSGVTTDGATNTSASTTTTTTTTTTTMNPRFGWPSNIEENQEVGQSSANNNPVMPWSLGGDEEAPIEDDKPRDFAVDPPRNDEEFTTYTEYLVNTFSETVDNLVTEQVPALLSFASELKLSTECNSEFLNIYLSARQFQPWAIRMLDATGKVPDGILHGTLTSFGSYDECLDIVVDDGSDRYSEPLRGQYCTVKVKPFLPPEDGKYKRTKLRAESVQDVAEYFRYVQFHIGICIPSRCSLDDMKGFASLATRVTKMNVTATKCEVRKPVTLDNEEMTAGCVIAAIIVLIVFGTACDIVRNEIIHRRAYDAPQKPSAWTKLIQAFSVYSNGRYLLNTKTKENTILPLHAMRVLSILWIILGHTYLSFIPQTSAGLSKISDATGDTLFQMVTNADLATDTFFFISGFLVCYIALKKLRESKGRFNILLFYVHRYLRMTPAVMLLLAIVIFAHRLGDGPLWKEMVDEKVETCKRMWWTNLVYINNFLRREDICFVHLWYISADMQYYIFSPIVFLLLFRRPKLGKILIAVGVCLCIIVSAVLTYHNNYPPILLFNDMSPWLRRQYYYNIFRMPFYHAGVYLIGMAAAYFVSKQDKKLTIRPFFQLLGWCASTATCLFIIFITTNWNRNTLPSATESAFYTAFARTAWALSIGWIVIMCSTGHGGFIRTILSWKFFVPLSRVSYLAYLIHPGLISVYTGQTRVLLYYSHYNAIYAFFAHTVTTYLCAFALSFAIEAPFRRIERVLCSNEDTSRGRLNMLTCVCDEDNQSSGSFATKQDGTASTGWTDKFSTMNDPDTISNKAASNDKSGSDLPKIVVHECHL